jgi:hypothetical protein
MATELQMARKHLKPIATLELTGSCLHLPSFEMPLSWNAAAL